MPVPHVTLDIFEVERLIPISEEINDCDSFPGGDPGKQIDDGLAPRVTKEMLEAVEDMSKERKSVRTGARQVHLPFSQVMEERELRCRV